MDFAARGSHMAAHGEDGGEQRAAPRFTLLIRAAKLACDTGQFVCVLRDVSETGVSVRLFHALPQFDRFELHMPAGAVYPMARVWERGHEAGFRFDVTVAVESLINEASSYPKRGLRLHLEFPVTVATLTQRCPAMVANLSQQGALLECDGLFAIDQAVRIEGGEVAPELKEIRAKVRWRRGTRYGVVFDDTFTLSDFAKLAARLQMPELAAS
ncbi:MAG: PilZ domain-containing protein [Erythrobacter sp.]